MYIEYELSGFNRIWKVDEFGVGYRWVMSKEDLNILVIEYSIWDELIECEMFRYDFGGNEKYNRNNVSLVKGYYWIRIEDWNKLMEYLVMKVNMIWEKRVRLTGLY